MPARLKNPLFKAGGVPLVWDSDLNPEGVVVKFKSGGFFGTVGGFSVEERSSEDDSLLYVLQAGYKFSIGEDSSLTAGAGYFAYTNTIGNKPFFDEKPRGNTVDQLAIIFSSTRTPRCSPSSTRNSAPGRSRCLRT